MSQSAPGEPAQARILHVTIDCPSDEVHAFLSDVSNWPRWCVVNILNVSPGPEDEWWAIETPDGAAEIRIWGDPATGVIDHGFREPSDPDDVALVPARVVPNGRGADFSITIFQPSLLENSDFDHFLDTVETELSTLKGLLESRPGGTPPVLDP